ncbi:PD-(D/E)XK nuclease family protein [Arenibacter amylolyticus]|uniref:PD-(D/E)XK nuclease family protein n=1 Tax=Arenibacter amylolyticus TaxID=1406873 RepID=UPI000A3B3766|nr:PD-(D/E)XK nuclease family protein [Arenibacter amylolyticus]
MKSFIQQIVDHLLDTYPSLDNITVVLPSKRAGTVLKTALANTANKTCFAPKIYSIENFVAHISQLETASSTEQLFTLYEAYQNLEKENREPFAAFAKWGQILLQDFNEIDRYLIDAQDIFSYLKDIQELNHWSLQADRSQIITNYLQFWKQLHPLYTTFNKLLKDKHIGHQGLIYRTACEELPQYLENRPETTHVFAGFNALNTAESHIIQELLSKGKAEILWDIDPYFLNDPVHDAGYFIRQHKKNWPWLQHNPLKGLTNYYSHHKNIHIIGVPKNVSQTKYVGNLLLQLKQKNAANLKNTAIVLGDENLLNPLLNSIPQEIDTVNITMGYPLSSTPLASMFSQYLDLHLKKDGAGWYFQQVLDFLSHPYVQLLFTHHNKNHASLLADTIKKNNWAFVSPKNLVLDTPEIQLLLDLFFLEKQQSAAQFLINCQKVVLSLKEKFLKTKDNLGLEYLYKFYSLFNQLQEMVATYAFINDLKSLESLYRELLRTETLDFQGEPLEGLQIMGMLESRALDFETVILTSVNEGILPSGKSNNSFIPFDLKKYYQLPTYKEKDAVYTYHFYRLLQRAKNIYLVYNTEPDVLEGGEKSRLLTQLLTDENKISQIKESIAAPEIQSTPKTLQIVHKDTGLMELIKKHAENGFSPTSLTNYVRNPIDFYKRNLLGINETIEVEETVASNTFGTIVHDSLEDLYKPYLNQVLTEAMVQDMQGKVKTTVLYHFNKSFAEGDISKGINLIAYEVVLRYISNFLAMEIEAVKKHEIRVIGIEINLRMELEIPGIDFPIVLKGKLDRIDEKDGQPRIIDYKTGKVMQGDVELIAWDPIIEDYKYSKCFQLLCYALMYNHSTPTPSLEAGIISFKNLKSGVLSFATKEKKGSRTKDKQITQETIALFTTVLNQLISEICNPDIPLTEKEV